MIGQIQDLVSAAVVIGATEASANVGDATQGVSSSQAANQQTQQDSTNKAETPAASVDILNQVKNAANGADKSQNAQDPNQQDDDTEKKLDEKSVSYITKELNELMSRINCNLQFDYHKEVNTMSVKMLDKKTGDVLKEVPPEDLIKHMIKAKDWLGAFLDKTI